MCSTIQFSFILWWTWQVFVCLHAHAHTCTCKHTHVHAHTHMQAHARACTHAHTHTQRNTKWNGDAVQVSHNVWHKHMTACRPQEELTWTPQTRCWTAGQGICRGSQNRRSCSIRPCRTGSAAWRRHPSWTSPCRQGQKPQIHLLAWLTWTGKCCQRNSDGLNTTPLSAMKKHQFKLHLLQIKGVATVRLCLDNVIHILFRLYLQLADNSVHTLFLLNLQLVCAKTIQCRLYSTY